MIQPPIIFLLAACLAFLGLSLSRPSQTTAAQAAMNARIAAVDISAYPQIQIALDVHTAEGIFLSGVTAEQVSILENNQRIQPDELRQETVGVQFITAMTLGPAFGVRDGQGVTRYEYLVEGLRGWSRAEAGDDDISLLISDGPELIHSTQLNTWKQMLQDFQPNTRQATPNLQLLSQALDIAADPTLQPGMDRVVLFITPPLGVEASVGLQSLAGRAQQEGIRIHVWLVASSDYVETAQAAMLSDLAAQTSGAFFFFTGVEPIPDLEEYLKPQRSIYQLSYTSAITTTGAFPVKIEINLADASVVTPDKLVQFDVQPPNPVFLAAPAEIQRNLIEIPTSDPRLQATTLPLADRLTPSEQVLQILVEFPDGRTRALQHSALYVNGVLADEHTQAPFDQFTWNLESITQTQQVILRAEVTDSLGLTSRTVDFPVQVVIEAQSGALFRLPTTRSLALIAITVGLAGGVLALVLVMGGRIRPRVVGRLEGARASFSQASTRPIPRSAATQPSRRAATRPANRKPDRALDPVTQPVNIPQPASSSRKRWTLPSQLHIPVIPALKWGQPRLENKRSEVFLEPLPSNEETAPEAPLPLSAEEIIIGRSAAQATLIINEPSLEAVHARLVREAGSFRLYDAGTLAGTWLNYTPLPAEGALLQHGDILHVGRVGFRFALRSPGRTRKPTITPYAALPEDLKALADPPFIE